MKINGNELTSVFSWIEKVRVDNTILTVHRKNNKVTHFQIANINPADVTKLINLLGQTKSVNKSVLTV